MILAIDIGNTKIVFGIMDEKSIHFSCRLATDRYKTSDEYQVLLKSLLEVHHVDPSRIEGSILSSVVPALKKTMADAVEALTGKHCMIVGPGLKNGLKIRIDNPAQLGSDRVADAVGALAEYRKPILIFDMGTATTFSVIDKQGEYRGGMIMPGAVIGLDALASMTSQLPQISLTEKPSGLIGTNTVDSMRSGLIYGNAAMLDGIVERVRDELGEMPSVVATGEFYSLIVPYSRQNVRLDQNLLLKGLRVIYLRNRRDGRNE